MTYTVTITQPGAEPVSVSLEWTTEAPKAVGLYFAERRSDGVISPVELDGDGDVFFTGNDCMYSAHRFSRWLGPIPLAPKGE